MRLPHPAFTPVTDPRQNSGEEFDRLFDSARAGDASAADRLHVLLYAELRELASRFMRNQPRGHTLQPTALANEAYIKASKRPFSDWQGRVHYVSFAARAMRSVLVDHARARARRGRRDVQAGSALDQIVVAYEDRAIDLPALDEKLKKLESFDPIAAQLVELRFFGDLTMAEAAKVVNVPERSLERVWSLAKAWLYKEIA
jgi:RNA polymerase sigma factor (TIGR02999 family)